MTNKKKRTSLDALGLGATVSSTDTGAKSPKKVTGSRRSAKAENADNSASASASPIEKPQQKAVTKEKEEIVKTTVYAPRSVFEQWRELAFTERKKMHDYLLEGLERVFADRGLKSIDELTGKE